MRRAPVTPVAARPPFPFTLPVWSVEPDGTRRPATYRFATEAERDEARASGRYHLRHESEDPCRI